MTQRVLELGRGKQGLPGPAGLAAYSKLGQQFIQPEPITPPELDLDLPLVFPITQLVLDATTPSTWMVAGNMLFVEGSGYHQILSVDSPVLVSTQLQANRLDELGAAQPGVVVPVGNKLGPAGKRGDTEAKTNSTQPVGPGATLELERKRFQTVWVNGNTATVVFPELPGDGDILMVKRRSLETDTFTLNGNGFDIAGNPAIPVSASNLGGGEGFLFVFNSDAGNWELMGLFYNEVFDQNARKLQSNNLTLDMMEDEQAIRWDTDTNSFKNKHLTTGGWKYTGGGVSLSINEETFKLFTELSEALVNSGDWPSIAAGTIRIPAGQTWLLEWQLGIELNGSAFEDMASSLQLCIREVSSVDLTTVVDSLAEGRDPIYPGKVGVFPDWNGMCVPGFYTKHGRAQVKNTTGSAKYYRLGMYMDPDGGGPTQSFNLMYGHFRGERKS